MTTIRSRELERMLARVRASVFITTDVWEGYQCAAAAAEMAPRLPALRHRVVLGEVVGDDEIDFVQFFQERPPRAPARAPATSATDPDAVALVLFTSGTTGEPKAVLRTLNNVYAQLVPAPRTRRTGPRAASAAPAPAPRPNCARWPQRRRSTRRTRAGS